MLPKKHSSLWVWILAAYTALVFATILFSQNILQVETTTRSIIAFLIIALGSAAIASIGGFLGAKIYFIFSAGGALLGLIYTLYIAVFNASPGWGDLTSIVGYFTFAIAGLGIGVVSETVMFFIKAKKK